MLRLGNAWQRPQARVMNDVLQLNCIEPFSDDVDSLICYLGIISDFTSQYTIRMTDWLTTARSLRSQAAMPSRAQNKNSG